MKLGDRVKDSEKQPISLDLLTACLRPLGQTNRKGDFGENIFQALIELKLGWIAIKHPRLDNAGIDREFRLFEAKIDTQIKMSTMSKDGIWSFSPFRQDSTLDKELYSQPDFYLVLIGLHCEKNEFLKFLKHSIRYDPLKIRKTIFTIPGNAVIEHFKEKWGHNIAINSRRLKEDEYKWLRGTKNPYKTFAKEFKRQTKREMPMAPLQ